MNINEHIEQSLKKFDEKVNDLENPYFLDNADGEVAEFGYKTQKGNELFKIVDFGNIRKHLSSELHTLAANIRKEERENHHCCKYSTFKREDFCDYCLTLTLNPPEGSEK